MSSPTKGLRIGITGSVACGKSAAVEMLAALGLLVIKVDDIVHRFLKEPNEVYDLLAKRYGQSIIGQDGAIVRSLLAGFVFESDASRKEFDSLFYPHVFSHLDQQLAQAGAQDTVVESAMLFEWKLESRFDEMWCVTCHRRQQIARHMKRNGISREESVRIINSQWSQSKKARLSKRVICNTEDLSHLERQVESALKTARNSTRD